MVKDVNEAESERDKSLKEFNTINTSINNILDCVSNIIDKEIKKGLLNGYIPSGVYNLGVTSNCVHKDDCFITTV